MCQSMHAHHHEAHLMRAKLNNPRIHIYWKCMHEESKSAMGTEFTEKLILYSVQSNLSSLLKIQPAFGRYTTG